MQRLKELADTGFNRDKLADAVRWEQKRRAMLSNEEREIEDLKNEELKLIAEASRLRLDEMVDDRKFAPQASLNPHERSFLIQPENKKDRARIPTIFA